MTYRIMLEITGDAAMAFARLDEAGQNPTQIVEKALLAEAARSGSRALDSERLHSEGHLSIDDIHDALELPPQMDLIRPPR